MAAEHEPTANPPPAPDEEEEEDMLPRPVGSVDLAERAETLGIKYFLVAYTPLNTDTRFSVIPKRAIGDVQRNGCGIPAAMYFDATGKDPEMYILPDPATLIQLPWKPEYGWLSGDLYMHGRPYSQCPRRALKRVAIKALNKGFIMKSGIEPEFMIINKEGTGIGDPEDGRQPMCLQEPLATMRMAPIITKISDVMEKLGWGPYELDHEASCCQYEINFDYVDALTMADRHAFMKFMMKEIASLEGYRITFMPLPFHDSLCANGLHVNVSLWNASDGNNAFMDSADDQLGLSKIAYHFIGGLMKHAEASCAIVCPTVNSYKRLCKGSWCPNRVAWGGNNRTVLFRVPANNRVEHRLPDGSANPYLTQAVILAAGLDGIKHKSDPGERCDFLVPDNPDQFRKMPENLLDALRALEKNDTLREALGEELVKAYITMRRREWDQFSKEVTKWETHYYLNC